MDALDVAEYILEKASEMPAMKLQKLVFYCQAWSLVWDDRALFSNRIEAWANGPVCIDLYSAHRQQYIVKNVQGIPSNLDSTAINTIDSVLQFYGDKTSQWLSDLTHSEAPWQDARRGLLPGQRGTEEIKHSEMVEYYGSL